MSEKRSDKNIERHLLILGTLGADLPPLKLSLPYLGAYRCP